MRILNCPKQDTLFGYVTVPEEMSLVKRLGLKAHLKSCPDCLAKTTRLTEKWDTVFSLPQVDISASLVKVYSQLQRDETLILKGWKLGDNRSRGRSASASYASSGWMFRGAIAAGLVGAVSFMVTNRNNLDRGKDMTNASGPLSIGITAPMPFAQIRVEDKGQNRIKVHYVQPELLKTVEFETTNPGGSFR